MRLAPPPVKATTRCSFRDVTFSPLQRLERLHRLATRRHRRVSFPLRVIVRLRGASPVRVAPLVARVLPPCPFPPRLDEAGASFEVFRDRAIPPDTPTLLAEQRGSSLPSIRPRRTLSRGSTPCESPGCASRAALAVSTPALAGARVRLSWGSSSLRRLQLQVPRFCHDRLDRPRETRDTTPSPGSAHGLSQPLGGLSRDDIRRARVAPLPPFAPSLRPGVSRPCCMPRRPWDSPFRAFPSRGAVPPLDGLLLPREFDVDRDSGAKIPWLSDRFPPRAASEPCAQPP